MLQLAHAGHWAPYVAAPLVVLAAVAIATIRERLRGDDPPKSESDDAGLAGDDAGDDPNAQHDEPLE